MADVFDANPERELPEPPVRLWELSPADGWNGVDETVFGIFTALEGSGDCPALDDISLLYRGFQG